MDSLLDIGSQPIKVAQFRDTMNELVRNTIPPEILSALKKSALKARDEISSDLKPSSEFFCDATLFSLLREYRDSKGMKSKRKRQSGTAEAQTSETIAPESGGGNKKVRKSQARDVMPGRLLDAAEEERGVQHPHVPKKRQYLSNTKTPAIVLNAQRLQQQNNSASTTNGESSSTHERHAEPRHSTTPFVSTSASVLPMSVEISTANSSSAALALPPTSSIPITHSPQASTSTQIENDRDNDESEESDDNENDNDDEHEEDLEETAFLAPPDNPLIAKTSLETRYLNMAKLLDSSKLATLRPENRYHITKSQALTTNFLVTDAPDESGGVSNKKRIINKIKDIEVVLAVDIYQEKHPGRKLQEFRVLGSQPLSALRDCITCGSDIWMESELEHQNYHGREKKNVTQMLRQKQKKRRFPSYFYINQCFYSDERHPEVKHRADDPCDAIINWISENAQHKTPNLEGIEKKPMHKVKFEELEIRLNHPYMFCHQDVCKHILVFRDIWLHGGKDEQDVTLYPITTFQCKMTRNKCQMCQVWPAEFVTLNDVMSGHSPAFFCIHCYEPFHFDKQGNRMWPHQVRRYAL